jgi:hypothetical protein
MLTTYYPQITSKAPFQENTIVLQYNDGKQRLTDIKLKDSIATDPSIQQRIVSTKTQDDNDLSCILTKIQIIIKNDLEKLNDKLESALVTNLKHNLEGRIHAMPDTEEYDRIINFLLDILTNIKNDIPTLKQIITKNILLDRNVLILIKNNPYKKDISTTIVNLATEYKNLKDYLIAMLDELNLLAQQSITILETTNFEGLKREAVVNLQDITLTQLFAITSPLYDYFNSILRKTTNDKKLDNIAKQLQQQTLANHKTEALSVNNFLEPNKDFIQDIIIGRTENMLFLIKIIDGIFSVAFR